jgi:hypothetical protein
MLDPGATFPRPDEPRRTDGGLQLCPYPSGDPTERKDRSALYTPRQSYHYASSEFNRLTL